MMTFEALRHHLAGLVGDLLDVNQLESGLLELQPSDFDLTALLEEAVARLQPASGQHPIRLEAIASPRGTISAAEF